MKKNEKIVKIFKKNILLKVILITFLVITLSIFFVFMQKMELYSVKINNKEFEREYGKICAYISGAVNNPGVYNFNENTKLEEALNIIGGIKTEADISKVDLLKALSDSEKITIPYKQNDTDDQEENNFEFNESNDDKININKADDSLLMSLPGIGQSTANKIIEYRKNGDFETIEDIKKVSGIGDSKFEKIKDKITVE